MGVRQVAVDCIGSMVDPIAKFDPLGNLVVGFGAGMFNHPHGLHVDHDGNVWATDDHGGGGKGHTVFKFSPQGMVLMTLGKPGIQDFLEFLEMKERFGAGA
jgi:secreted PhoX family phosphatase